MQVHRLLRAPPEEPRAGVRPRQALPPLRRAQASPLLRRQQRVLSPGWLTLSASLTFIDMFDRIYVD